MKRFGILAVIILAIMFMGCGSNSSTDKVAQKAQEVAHAEAEAETGLPAISNWQEKKMVKMIYESRDQADLVCHAYLMNTMHGTVGQYLGPCIGFGIPASVQYSNPRKTVWQTNGTPNRLSVPQAEPNGLFMPEGLSATWLFLLDPVSGEAKPCYIEPLILVFPFKFPSTE